MTQTSAVADSHHDDDYTLFSKSIQSALDRAAAIGPLFTTDARDLFQTFLTALPQSEQQHYTCHACRHFIERFGGLVTITPDGDTVPAMWPLHASGIFEHVTTMLCKVVGRARVTGVFLSREKVWGQPVTGPWHHMAARAPSQGTFSRLKTDGQLMAEKKEEYGMLCRGLAEFPAETVQQAVNLLETEALYRNEKCLGPAKWLAELHEKRKLPRGLKQENVTWLAVAKAPPGFCHVRTTMVGTLLEDIAAGMPFDAIKRRFDDKMNPLLYQRPQSPPSAGNIAQAEKIVRELQSAGALERRFAKLDDLQKMWVPRALAQPAHVDGEVFGHLKPSAQKQQPIEIPASPITWEKFSRTVLTEAEQIELLVPHGGNYLAFVTAQNPEAPPIIQWDSEKKRNPVSWYVYRGGTLSTRWALHPGSWTAVTAVVQLPFMWDETKSFAHQVAGVVLVLDNCRDTTPHGGAALFPEVLKSDYHSIRHTIEAFSLRAKLHGADGDMACGADLRKGVSGRWGWRVRVTSSGGSKVVQYTLDRWD